MKRYLGALGAAVLCANLAMAASEESDPVELKAMHLVHNTFHSTASTKNLNMMMLPFADDANLSVGDKKFIGKDQVRNYYVAKSILQPTTTASR
jgi:hypothetical protein